LGKKIVRVHTSTLRTVFICTLIASSASLFDAALHERTAAAKKDASKEDKEKARQTYEQGKTAYNLGDFDKAIELWKAGYEYKNDPIFLFNIAQAYRQKADHTRAVFFYKSYLREAPDAKNRTEVETRIAELQKLIDAGRTQTDAPPSGVGDLGTGNTTTTTTEPDTTTTTTTEPDTTEPNPDAEPTPDTETKPDDETREEQPPQDTGNPRPGRGLKIAGIVTGGAGVALVVTGIVFAMKASSLQGELEDAVAMGTPWNSDLDSKRSDGKSAASLSAITLGIGVAAVVGGGVLYVLGMKKDNAAAASGERAWMIVPEVSPEGAGVLVRFDY
jgi:tetratricopeptide (TPR) repeat protein